MEIKSPPAFRQGGNEAANRREEPSQGGLKFQSVSVVTATAFFNDLAMVLEVPKVGCFLRSILSGGQHASPHANHCVRAFAVAALVCLERVFDFPRRATRVRRERVGSAEPNDAAVAAVDDCRARVGRLHKGDMAQSAFGQVRSLQMLAEGERYSGFSFDRFHISLPFIFVSGSNTGQSVIDYGMTLSEAVRTSSGKLPQISNSPSPSRTPDPLVKAHGDD